MPTLQQRFTPEQNAKIADWVRLYSKGKSLDFKRVQAEDPQGWAMVSNGHPPSSIRAKVYSHRMLVTKDVPPKPSLGKNYRAHRKFQCKKCDFTTDSKQSMAVHYRFQHPKNQVAVNGAVNLMPGIGSITANVPVSMVNQFVIVSPDGTVRLAKLIKHCPECLEPMMPLNVARNI